jgi:protein TonB
MPSLKNPKADLRIKYSRYVKIGLIFSLALIIIAFKLSPDPIIVKMKQKTNTDTIFVEPPIRTTQEPQVPPPPKAPEIIAASIDNVPDDYLPPEIDDYTPVPLPDAPPKPKIDLPDEEFIPVPEELPAPVGGLKSLQEKVHYTEIAKRAGVEGTVFIQAKIDKNGNVVDAFVKKGLGAGLDEEALNAVRLTTFIPGKQRGRPVNVIMVIPIKFVLK